MSANSHQLVGVRIGYGLIIVVLWVMVWGCAAYSSLGWILGKAPYFGPWDRSVHAQEYPDVSFFLLGGIISVCMLALSVGGMVACLIVLRKARRGGNNVFSATVPLDAQVLTLVLALSLVLCGVLSWWMGTYTD